MRASFYQEKQVKLISTWHRHILHIYPVRTCPTAHIPYFIYIESVPVQRHIYHTSNISSPYLAQAHIPYFIYIDSVPVQRHIYHTSYISSPYLSNGCLQTMPRKFIFWNRHRQKLFYISRIFNWKKIQSNDKIEDKISVAAVKTNVIFYCWRCSVWSFEEMNTLFWVHCPVHFFTNARSSKK